MNIIEKLIDAKIVDNAFHAAGMLNVLECVTLATDDERLERCRLYVAWKKYYGNSKDFTNQTKAKEQARKNAIAGLAVPELPMLLTPFPDSKSDYMTDAEVEAMR